MPPRKYKAKPPISALDETAAQHRRAQSCKAQRAYRQRKEETIATLTSQIKVLERQIEDLSCCFLGLNDKILKHLGGDGKMEGEEGLAKGIRDSMEEFKGIIERGEGDGGEEGEGDNQVVRSIATANTTRMDDNSNAYFNNGDNNNGIPTPPESGTAIQNSYTTFPSPHPQLQLQLPQSTSSPPQQKGSTIFSGPAFYGLTPQTLPLHPSTSSSSPESLAHHIYKSTIAKAFSLLQSHADEDPIFRRVFAVYFTVYPEDQVRGEVAKMMLSRGEWNPYYRGQRSEVGWWSALQVASFICSRGWRFDGERGRVCLNREGEADLEVEVERFLDEILIDARCAWDTPEYRKDTVVRTVFGMNG